MQAFDSIEYFFLAWTLLTANPKGALGFPKFLENSMGNRVFGPASWVAGAVMALSSLASSAATVTYFGTQDGKSTSQVSPPALTQAMVAQVAGFTSNASIHGRNEFEGGSGSTFGATAGTGNFSYGVGGLATLSLTGPSGTDRVVGATQSPPGAGRYNMTQNVAVDSQYGEARGHWLDVTRSFTYSFNNPITAFGFYGTDLGDLRGTFNLQLFSGSTEVFASGNIVNPPATGGAANATLFFLGVLSTVSFDRAVFNVAQAANTPANNPDVLGFDSILVGQALPGALPEPSSLALAGLALLGLGVSLQRRRKA